MRPNQALPIPAFEGPIFDSDTHIHERNFNFFKEYLPQKYHKDWLLTVRDGAGGYGLYVGDRKVENSEYNRDGLVPPPGRLKEWLKAMKEGKSNVDGWIKPTEDMMDRDQRIKKLDEFGVESSILFVGTFVSTFGYYNPDASGNAVLHAYNEYVRENWSFNYKDRFYATGCLSLWDLETSLQEADWLIKNGVRVVVMPMGPAHGKSPAHEYFDPLWAKLNEAEVAVTFHVSEATFMHPLIHAWGEKPLQRRRTGQTAWQWMFCYNELPVQMTLANIIFHNFFERFPKIKIASVENGCGWLPRFLETMDKMRGMAKNGYWPRGQLKERPSNIFKRHCSVVAYPEDDIQSVVNAIGTADCIMMGSDYPHAEGVPAPHDFIAEACGGLSAEQTKAIMYGNGRKFIPKR